VVEEILPPVEELEAELTRDEQRLREIERMELQLLQDIPLVGFRTAIEEFAGGKGNAYRND
jgi:hypothetical protein